MGLKWITDPAVLIYPREVHGSQRVSYNSVSGNPTFSVQLAIPWNQVKEGIAQILGKPEKWPKTDTVMQNIVAVSAELTQPSTAGVSDADGQVISYADNAIITFNYLPRPGRYVTDYNGKDVYWYDEMEPRYESKPVNHRNLVWGNTTNTAPDPATLTSLHETEAPSLYDPGQTLIHTIEGWTLGVGSITDYIGTVASDIYMSDNLNYQYDAKTLMLRSYTITMIYSFISHRLPAVPPIVAPLIDFSGLATPVLRLVYEHKKEGWEKFRRVKLEDGSFDYYYIRYNKDPYDQFIPFPAIPHDIYLKKL